MKYTYKKMLLAILTCGMLNFNVFADVTSSNNSQNSASEDNVVGATIRENDFFIQFGDGVDDVKTDYIDNTVTEGQPHDEGLATNEIIRCQGTEGGKATQCRHIVYKAGRKGSTDVANEFLRVAGGSSNNVLGNDLLPEKLNFFIKTSMSINGSPIVSDNGFFLIGQGHSNLFRNVWWIGSSGLNHFGVKSSVKLKTVNGQCYEFRLISALYFYISHSTCS